MTSDKSRTTWSPWSETAPVSSSPCSRRTRACWALVLTLTQRSAKASDATNSRTSRSISPLTAPASGPTSFCRRGRSVMTPAKTSFRTASMSTCCSMALVTVVAMASCTSGECTRGPTVSRYRWVSLSVRWPQYATRAGVVSSTANTTQTTTPTERPVLRRSVVGGSMVWVDPASAIPGLLGPTRWAHTVPTCGSAMCRPRNRRMIILLVPGPRAVGPGSSSTRPSRPPAQPPRSSHTVAALRRSLGREFGQPRVSGNHPQGMNCHLQPSSQAAQADTPSHQLINHDLACPRMPTAGRPTLTVLTRPAGHRRRVRNPTRQPPRTGGPLPTRQP